MNLQVATKDDVVGPATRTILELTHKKWLEAQVESLPRATEVRTFNFDFYFFHPIHADDRHEALEFVGARLASRFGASLQFSRIGEYTYHISLGDTLGHLNKHFSNPHYLGVSRTKSAGQPPIGNSSMATETEPDVPERVSAVEPRQLIFDNGRRERMFDSIMRFINKHLESNQNTVELDVNGRVSFILNVPTALELLADQKAREELCARYVQAGWLDVVIDSGSAPDRRSGWLITLTPPPDHIRSAT